ncbi:MAG: hypothetical protein KDB80_13015, partial [Planctomycetes bacterium]|nr:hypothetical protein [Planctomycetota bacterium]
IHVSPQAETTGRPKYEEMALWGSKKRARPKPSREPEDRMEPVRQTSSLPSGVFKALDKDVEQELNGPVADVFLRHMVAPNAKQHADAMPAEIVENRVDPAEIEAFLARYDDPSTEPAPDVERNLATERTWVLADLATHGSGRARELATRELREFADAFDRTDDFDLGILTDLVTAITERQADGNVSVLLQLLLSAANRTLERVQEQHDD